jgi:hypothetical protein
MDNKTTEIYGRRDKFISLRKSSMVSMVVQLSYVVHLKSSAQFFMISILSYLRKCPTENRDKGKWHTKICFGRFYTSEEVCMFVERKIHISIYVLVFNWMGSSRN